MERWITQSHVYQRYANHDSTHRTDWTPLGQNCALLGENGRRNKEWIGSSSSLKAVDSIIRASGNGSTWCHGSHYGKNTARGRDPNSQLQCFAGWCNSPTSGFLAADSIRRAERSYQQHFPVIQCSSGICFYGIKWRKKSQEFVQPWFQPNRGQEWTKTIMVRQVRSII